MTNSVALPQSWLKLPRDVRDMVLAKLLARRQKQAAASALRLLKAERSLPVPVSLEQEFFLRQQARHEGQLAWTIAAPPIVVDQPDAEKIKAAFVTLALRHDMLHTTFHLEGERFVMQLSPGYPVPFEVTKVPLTAAITGAESWIRKHFDGLLQQTFHAAEGPLWRAELVMRGKRGVILMTFCSLIADGESLYLIERDLRQLLEQPSDTAVEIPAFDYADYAHTQAELLRSGHYDRPLGWWRERLAGGPPGKWLDKRAVAAPAKIFEQSLSSETGRALDTYAASHNTTAATVLLTEYMALLRDLDDNDDLWIALSTSARDLPDTGEMVGTFARQVLLRHRWGANGDALAGVHAAMAETMDQPPVPHLAVKDMLSYQYPQSASPYRYIFNHRVVGQGMTGEVAARDVPFRFGPAGTADLREEDLLFMALQSGETRTLQWFMRTDRFDLQRAEELLRRYYHGLIQRLGMTAAS